MEHHLAALIYDLCLILMVAGITTLIFKKIKQPIVLGYILAGLLISPHVPYIPTVQDEASISTWSEIGVIFLLFSLGLEFSFKKLAKVGGQAGITAIVEIVLVIGIGFALGKMLGWPTMDCIFLGAILSMSSTTIILRAFEELGIKRQRFAKVVFGTLVVEDIVAILLLVFLSTLSASQSFSGNELFMQLLTLGGFLLFWFLAGIFIIPTFLRKTRNLMNDETLLVVSIGLCLSMVLLSTSFGFSAELGAFIMGSLLAETTQAERVEHVFKSVKDMFAAIFFVSVGMMINPELLAEHIWPVLLITLVTIVGKFIGSAGGALLSGQPPKQSVQVGMSMAQIGEFAFIIATLGMTLGVTSDFLYPIVVSVSAITTFTTPYMIKQALPFYNFMERKLPKKWMNSLSIFSSDTRKMTETSEWKKVLKSNFINILISVVVIVAIIMISTIVLQPFLASSIDPRNADIISVSLTLLLISPFAWALAVREVDAGRILRLWQDKKLSRGPIVMLKVLRVSLAVIAVGYLLTRFVNVWWAMGIALLVIVAAMVLINDRLQRLYSRIENRFLSNLYERENAEAADKARPLIESDTQLQYFTVKEASIIVDKSFETLALSEQFDVRVVLIQRGELLISNPSKETHLYPGDLISVMGTRAQLEEFRSYIESEPLADDEEEEENTGEKESLITQKIVIKPESPLVGMPASDPFFKEKLQSLVIGITRDGDRIFDTKDIVFREGDIVFLIGNNKLLAGFLA